MSKQWRFCVRLVREILGLKFNDAKKSEREIARIHSISKNTVRTYIARAEIAGIKSIEHLNAVDDIKLKEIIFPHPAQTPKEIEINFNMVHKEMARPHVTLMLIWKELSEGVKPFYGYSRFCELYTNWKKMKDLPMRQVHKAGEKIFIDYAGTTIPVVINKKTGEVQEAQIFVCCLGASQLSYIEATWSQCSKDFITSNIHALEFFGGVPEIFVPDNLKSAVNLANKYEPVINQSFRAMVKYYGGVVIPARAYRPKDKAKVENAVLIASRWILARIRDHKFFSLEELNQTLWDLLEQFNNAKFQKMDYSRRSFFEETEKAALRELPSSRYVVAEWKRAKLNIDYHVHLESCYYSAPYRLVGQELECRYTDTTVEIFNNGSRVASHARSHKAGYISTTPEHMPRSHREHLEWSPSRMLEWGKSIGPFTECCFQKLMDQCEHPELAYKACLGIIGLGKKYEKERVENACERAYRLGAVGYKSIKSILEKGLDRVKVCGEQQDLALEHENIRGKNYYQ
ncbi:MAG TPA: IS21 family transposase [Bacteriovoracaceae bacterium]|nr:IS21 family transposase [Bacteriovoracaceae bacterium]